MKVARSISELPHPSGIVGFVPTMGALHEGHLSLIRAAKKECGHVVVSLFVNPLQFGANEDLSKYPRQEAKDMDMAAGSGCDTLFIPLAEELLALQSTEVYVRGVSDLYEGSLRPGHFNGVTTIVCKLFNIVRPDVAYFGLKDRQQCAVIRKMVADLNMTVQLQFLATVRESDGLAISSRNAYLSARERAVAPALHAELEKCKFRVLVNQHADRKSWEADIANSAAILAEFGFAVEYLDIVNGIAFMPARSLDSHSVLVVAARLGVTRLIDNVALFGDSVKNIW